MIDFVPIDVIIMLVGVLFGLIAGMLPGVGNVVTLMLVYPFVTDFTLFQIILFYVWPPPWLSREKHQACPLSQRDTECSWTAEATTQ